MKDIEQKKYDAIMHVLTSYFDYKGCFISPLEQNINALEEKLSFDDFLSLKKNFDNHLSYLVSVLSRSHNIRVKFLVEDIDIFDDLNID